MTTYRPLPRAIIICIAVLLSAAGACAANNDLIVRRPADEKVPEVIIGPAGVSPPLGYFAIVKDGEQYCAVKFLETGDARTSPGKYPNYRYAIYEWHYQNDGSNHFLNATARQGTDKATWRFVPFIGRLSFQTGNVGVDCGDIHIAWYGGTALTFSQARKDETEDETIRRGVKISPTKWTDIRQVDVSDKHLSWYGYDTRRKSQSVPVDSLY